VSVYKYNFWQNANWDNLQTWTVVKNLVFDNSPWSWIVANFNWPPEWLLYGFEQPLDCYLIGFALILGCFLIYFALTFGSLLDLT
jgi:hypothetical protein